MLQKVITDRKNIWTFAELHKLYLDGKKKTSFMTAELSFRNF